MHSNLPAKLLAEVAGKKMAEEIGRCVHCGFCNATCPTYLITGDERDGPRGRIFLIKEMLEGKGSLQTARFHQDRCLTCLNCVSTCPSGVRYDVLSRHARDYMAERKARPATQGMYRWLLRRFLTATPWLQGFAAVGRLFGPLLPSKWKRMLGKKSVWRTHNKVEAALHVYLARGCVQPALAADIDAVLANVLAARGVQVEFIKSACCGAVDEHLQDHSAALARMSANLQYFRQALDDPDALILSSASACGLMFKQYSDYPELGDAGQQFSAKVRDLLELPVWQEASASRHLQDIKVAIQAPCTLQHGQQIDPDAIRRILAEAGAEILPVENPHLCCGSAGTYTVLQKKLSAQLLENKLKALSDPGPDVIVTANIGCLLSLRQNTSVPVFHWVQLLDESFTRQWLKASSG